MLEDKNGREKAQYYKSAWSYSAEIGSLLYSVLTNYSRSFLNCYNPNALEAHKKYIRPTYGLLFVQYSLVRPMVREGLQPDFDKEMITARKQMEEYLCRLVDGTGEPNYKVLDKFTEIHNELMVVMQAAGLLYAGRKYISKEARERQAYAF